MAFGERKRKSLKWRRVKKVWEGGELDIYRELCGVISIVTIIPLKQKGNVGIDLSPLHFALLHPSHKNDFGTSFILPSSFICSY